MALQHTLAFIRSIKREPELYVQPCTFFTLAAYLSGYMHALADVENENLRSEFTAWLRRNKGTPSGLAWMFGFLQHVASGDEERALHQILPVFEEFIESKLDESVGRAD